MKKERQKLYPVDWAFTSAYIRFNRARNRCEECGVCNGAIVYNDVHGNRKEVDFEQLAEIQKLIESSGKNEKSVLKMLRLTKIVLTVAHLDHDESNNDYFNLKALCQRDHFKYDRQNNKLRAKKYKLAQIPPTVIE